MSKRVAIIGAAYRFPGTTPDTFWQDLKNGKDMVTHVATDRWSQEAYQHPDRRHPGTSVSFAAGSLGDISGFDAEFFGISPREAAHMDPQQRILLELAWESLEDAGLAPATLRGSRCGVFLGVASLDYSYRMADDMCAIDAPSATGNTASIVANRLSYIFDLQGPSFTLDTACSSSLVAFHQACQAIRSGEITMAMTGGISLHLHPYGFLVFSKANMLSASGRCRVFDENGDGYVRSEGGGLFVLKDYDQAIADNDRILAVVAGTAVNTDGHKTGLTVPSPAAQTELMSRAYHEAGIDPSTIDYLEAHGTGTAVGDPIETRAIGDALGRKRPTPLPIGSIKSNMGHLETASGVAGMAKALYSLRYREVPATIGIQRINPRIHTREWNLDIVTQHRPLKPQGVLTVGVNSFGFGGANAHVILQSAPQPATEATSAVPATATTSPSVLPVRVSARSPAALRANAGRIAQALRDSNASFYDLAYSLSHRREHMTHGAICFADSAERAAIALEQLSDDAMPEAAYGMTLCERPETPNGPVFVYSGNGCQWVNMGQDLLAQNERFQQYVANIDALFQQHADFSLMEELQGLKQPDSEEDPAQRLTYTSIAQPTLFALQVALTQWLAHNGVVPAAVMGHSVGEVAAAWASGALSLADAVKVIYYRSYYQEKTRGAGMMAAAAMSADDATAWLKAPEFSDIAIAGVNSPRGITLAGPTAALHTLTEQLHTHGITARTLPLDYAFHSDAMDPTQSGLMADLADIRPAATRLPFISTVTGEALDGTALDASYWWHNIRQPVSFHAATAHLIRQGYNVFVEVGAHPILRRYLHETLHAEQQNGLIIGTLERHADGPDALTNALGQLLLSGTTRQEDIFFPVQGRHVELPHYAWQRTRHWMPATPDGQGLLSRYYQHPLLGYPLAQQNHTWESQLDTQRLPWLAGHVVGEGAVFPGAGFVELALAAALRHRRNEDGNEPLLLDIEALEIQAPMLLDTPHGRTLRLHLDANDGRMQMVSREPASEQEWQQHAIARCMQETHGSMLKQRAPALPARAPDYTRQEHLALAEHIGLHYSGAFSAITHGWMEGDSVFGVLTPDDDIQAQQQTLHLHPGLLDSAFQLFIPLLARKADSSQDPLAFVPVRLERVQFNLNAGTPVLAQAQMRRQSPHSFSADFYLFDAQGNAVAAISEARFKAVRLTRAAHGAMRYLDVSLVPAPLSTPPLMLDDNAMAALVTLGNTYAERTGLRYAEEVSPLLDSLSDAFSSRGLTLDGNASALAPEAVWQLLVRDYPDYFALTQLCGRLGLHRDALARGTHTLESLDITTDQLSRLNAVLPGAGGWQALSHSVNTLVDQALTALPHGQRLNLLEAGPCAPLLGQRLLERLPLSNGDSHYRALTTHDAARHQAQQLQERFPLIDLHGLSDDMPALPAAKRAGLALLSVDVTDADATRQLIAQLPALLAPGSQLLLLGSHPADWLYSALATPGLERTPPDAPSITAWLEQAGLEVSPPLALETQTAGIYLLHARLPAAPISAAGAADRHYLISAPAPAAQALQDALRQQGTSASIIDTDASPARALTEALAADGSHVTAGGLHLIDMAAKTTTPAERCLRAREWMLAIDDLALPIEAPAPTLWLATRGVASLWGGGDDSIPKPPEDAALWGFGRTLANEARGQRVVLLDLPETLNAAAVDACAASLMHADNENELVISPEGQRLATRLTARPRPEATPATAVAETATVSQALSLSFSMPGQLRHLQWCPRPLPALSNDDIEVRIHATGLNFRDVMYTLGLLSDEAIENGFAGPTLGLEFAGEVVRVGAGVTDLAPGQGVVGFGPASFSDRVVARRTSVAPLPEHIGYAAAATIPTTFFTVYYALKYLARVEPGESVLIHGAAGGVGIAAIQIARWLGADIHATAGSSDKHDFLQLMGIERRYDSRSLTFAEEILEATGGQGVDVVLNSLAGEAINQNLRALRPFGRFLELGKRDFYENTHIGLRPFRNNLSYFGIDSDQLMQDRPELTQRLFNEMMALFNDGTLYPLPYTLFPKAQVVDAFRYMQQARQIGKVVVTQDHLTPAADAVPAQARTRNADALTLKPEACYLVTGGLAGFGLKTAQWLADKGVRKLVLLSRSGPHSNEAQTALAEFKRQGVEVLATACDVTCGESLNALIQRATRELGPLAGVIHAATIIQDSLIQHLEPEQLRAVFAPKIDGAKHLDALTRGQPLDFFVVYSSATTLFGNPGQASYVAANHWLEGLVAARRQAGLPATAVRWGAIDDVGFLARNTRTRDALQERLGGSALNSDDALQVLEQILLADSPTLGVLELEWNALSRFLPTAGAARFTELARTTDGSARQEQKDDIGALLLTLSPDEQYATLVDVLRAELAAILLLEETAIDADRSVYDMGFDSLMGVELMTALEGRLGIQLPVMVLSEASTITRLASVIQRKLQQHDGHDSNGADTDNDANNSAMDNLARQHGVDSI